MKRFNDTDLRWVAMIGNYVPCQCGIATFTANLRESLAVEFPRTDFVVLSINDVPEGYDYPCHVRFEIEQQGLSSYRHAADFLNLNHADVVCLQHEYGIFGGEAGSHILTLVRNLQVPLVTTLHTVLREPDPEQRQVMEELTALSDRLVVLSRRGVQFLQEVYRVPASKIDMIPHGIPEMPFTDPNFYKDQFGVEGKIVLLTFGLLSPNKGIENMLHALPLILERYPNVVYIVLGATHPNIRRREGETYRLRLQQLVREKGIEQNVIFHNQFVSLDELIAFMGAADIYITPYLNREQIVSGTLAYAVGAGKAVISTPYWHAEELLAGGRGLLVPFGQPEAIAEQVIYLLENEAERHAMRKRAYLLGRQMVWPKVAQRYMESFLRAREKRRRRLHPLLVLSPPGGYSLPPLDRLPRLKLDHLRRLTDETGLLQHAVFTMPNYSEGYTTDDNARALLLSVLLQEQTSDLEIDLEPLILRYAAFLWHAFNPEAKRFRNLLAFDRRWQEEVGSEDSHGRAIWALGTVLGRSTNEDLRGFAIRLFEAALPAVLEFTSPRAWAFTLLGLNEYAQLFPGDRKVKQTGTTLAERLLALYSAQHSSDWHWFEEVLAYDNATLSRALLIAGEWLGRPEMIECGLKTLAWLSSVQSSKKGHFVPIGSRGFYRRGGLRARFDQQPLEAQATVSAGAAAYRITGQAQWSQEAQRAFEWFLGRNDLRLPLYDPLTGGCHDGLHPDRVNQNQGAEATLAFLMALVEMQRLTKMIQCETQAYEPILRCAVTSL